MHYKDLNVYQRAYQVAIDLHSYLENKAEKLSESEINTFKDAARRVIGNIAEGFTQKTTKAKRFYNFKALDEINKIHLDLDFLHDIKRFAEEEYKIFYQEYDICIRQLFKLNQAILERAEKEEIVKQ